MAAAAAEILKLGSWFQQMLRDQYVPCRQINGVRILPLKIAHLILELTAANLWALFFTVIHCLFESDVY